MGVFTKPRPREERLAEIEQAVTALGYTVISPAAAIELLAPLLPKLEQKVPENYGIGVTGKVDEQELAIITGYYTTSDNEGNVSTTDVLLTIVKHPNIQGTAVMYRDWKHSTGGAIVNKLLWIPPFTIVKMIQLIFDSHKPDLAIGDAEFDSMFKVHAESVPLAQQAIPPAARRYLAESKFDGTIVARPGVLIYQLDGARLDVESVTATIAAAGPLLSAFSQSTSDHPMR